MTKKSLSGGMSAKKKTGMIELLIVAVIVLLILLPQLIGTVLVNNASETDEYGYPVTDKTADDFTAPGTKIAVLTGTDWSFSLEKMFPDAEIMNYDSFADIYTAIDTGKVDVGHGFIDASDEIRISHPDLAFTKEPVIIEHYGFGTQNNEKGIRLCNELNTYLRELISSGEYEKLCGKWDDPERRGDVMENFNFTAKKVS